MRTADWYGRSSVSFWIGERNVVTISTADLTLDDTVLAGRIFAGIAEAEEREARLAESAALARRPVAHPVPDSPVPTEWQRLQRWLRAYAPRSVPVGDRPAESAIAAAQIDSGIDWPVSLVEFCRLGLGSVRLLPHGPFFSIDEMPAARRQLLAMEVEYAGEWVTAEGAEPAGSSTSGYIGALMPIAGERDTVCVDLRPGPLHGCVGIYMPDGGCDPTWFSIGAMLADLAISVETGREFTGLVPEVVDGVFGWEAIP